MILVLIAVTTKSYRRHRVAGGDGDLRVRGLCGVGGCRQQARQEGASAHKHGCLRCVVPPARVVPLLAAGLCHVDAAGSVRSFHLRQHHTRTDTVASCS